MKTLFKDCKILYFNHLIYIVQQVVNTISYYNNYMLIEKINFFSQLTFKNGMYLFQSTILATVIN